MVDLASLANHQLLVIVWLGIVMMTALPKVHLVTQSKYILKLSAYHYLQF